LTCGLARAEAMHTCGCFFGTTDDVCFSEVCIFFMDGINEITAVIKCKVWFSIYGAFYTSIEVVVVGISSEDMDSGGGECSGDCIIG
jgi:hypothetical protein